MISALHEIEAVCFNPLLIPWYQITHPPSPSPSNTLPPLTPATQPTQIPAFHVHQLAKTSGFFSPRGGNSFVILFDQYR